MSHVDRASKLDNLTRTAGATDMTDPAIRFAVALVLLGLVSFAMVRFADILLLVFAGAVVGLPLLHVSRGLARRWGLDRRLVLLGLYTAGLGLTIGLGFLIARPVTAQVDALMADVPNLPGRIAAAADELPFGRAVLESVADTLGRMLRGEGELADSDAIAGGSELLRRALGMFQDTAGSLVSILVVLAVSVYVSFDPDPYRDGLVRILPPAWRARVGAGLERVPRVLFWWFVGQAASMTILGTAVAAGLTVFGVPYPLLLGLFTAIMTFIPQLGPLIAAVPTLLAAATQGPSVFALVLAFLVVLQNVEGLLLTPTIHRRMIALPPLLVLLALLVLGSGVGMVGVLVAMPLVAVILTMMQAWRDHPAPP